MEEEKRNKNDNKISKENESTKEKDKEKRKGKEKIQELIAPPRYNPSKDKVTKGFSNDESMIGGSDTFQPNFPDA
jgi:hypothetical protein